MTEESGLLKKPGLLKESARYKESDRIKTLKKYIDVALSRKAENIVVLDVHELTSYTDYIIIMTGLSARQVNSVAEYIYKSMKNTGNAPIGVEGIKEGKWALLDFGDVIIHVFDQETRELYNIEGLWSDAFKIDLSEFASKFALETMPYENLKETLEEEN